MIFQAQEERNIALASAMGLYRADTSGTLKEDYGTMLLEMARVQPHFVKSIEAALATFVNSRQKQHAFPVMKSDKRQVIHELAKHYGQ